MMPRPFIPILLSVILLANFVHAARTDVIVLQNGDRVTGEIKKLEFGKLVYKTDDMGTIDIEWDKVQHVTAITQNFEVEVQNGTIYFGTLHPSKYRYRVQINQSKGPVDVFLWQIVRITPIKDSQLARLSADVTLGFDYTKASSVQKFILQGSASYTARGYRLKVSASSNTTRQPGKEESKRQELNLNGNRFLSKRIYTLAIISLQQNTELGVNFRLLVGGGLGRDLWVTNYHILQASGGVLWNREDAKDNPTASSAEAVFVANYDLFIYDDPKTDLNAKLSVFPNLSQWGRVRGEFATTLKYEFIKDFTLNLNYYFSLDNDPVSETASRSDWGVNLTFGYKY